MVCSKQVAVLFMSINGWSCSINIILSCVLLLYYKFSSEVINIKYFTGAAPFNFIRCTSRISLAYFRSFVALCRSFLSNCFEIHAPIVHWRDRYVIFRILKISELTQLYYSYQEIFMQRLWFLTLQKALYKTFYVVI